jgi:hypothetical protein
VICASNMCARYIVLFQLYIRSPIVQINPILLYIILAEGALMFSYVFAQPKPEAGVPGTTPITPKTPEATSPLPVTPPTPKSPKVCSASQSLDVQQLV